MKRSDLSDRDFADRLQRQFDMLRDAGLEPLDIPPRLWARLIRAEREQPGSAADVLRDAASGELEPTDRNVPAGNDDPSPTPGAAAPPARNGRALAGGMDAAIPGYNRMSPSRRHVRKLGDDGITVEG